MDSVETNECDCEMDASAYNGYLAGNMMNLSTRGTYKGFGTLEYSKHKREGDQYNNAPYFSKDEGVCKDSSLEKGGQLL